MFCEDPSPYLLCCGFPRGFLALLPKTISCLGSQRVLKGGSGPPDMKAVKPRQEDPEGLAGQVGCEGATTRPERGGPEAARSYLLHTVWDLRGAGQRPYTLHGQHVLQQLLAACGQTDRRTVGVRASAWHGSFTSDEQAFGGRAAGRQRARVSRRPAARSKAELEPPGCGEGSPGPAAGAGTALTLQRCFPWDQH